MIRRIASLLLSLVLLTSLAAFASGNADITGSYAVRGWEPGSSESGKADYTGRAEITARGDAYAFRADIDGQAYVGTGVRSKDGGAVAFVFQNADGSETGVTLLTLTPRGLEGRWIGQGREDGKAGREIWSRER